MTYLGVDYGLKKIGLAISDGIFPSTLPTLTYNLESEILERLTRLCQDHGIDKIVFGLPVPDKIGAKKFGEKLSSLSGKDIEFFDETLTTNLANQKLVGKKKKKSEDSLSAAKILEDYLTTL